jgi:hypothetical protein
MEPGTSYNTVTKDYENTRFDRSDVPIAMLEFFALILINVNRMMGPDIVDRALLTGDERRR